MMLKQKLARPAVLVLAGVVAILTFAVVVHAFQVITVANASLIPYNLAPGGFSAAITVPVADQPVLVMGTTTTPGFRGVGHVSLLRASAAPPLLAWVGLNSTGGGTITHFSSDLAGTFIVAVDLQNVVRIEIASASQIRVHNLATATRAGNVKMIW